MLPATLAKRLKELRASGVVDHKPIGATYTLTEAGKDKELLPVIQGLGKGDTGGSAPSTAPTGWTRRCCSGTSEGSSDRELRRGSHRRADHLPRPAARRRYYWVVDEGRDVDLCLTDPGTPVDAE